MPGTDDRDLDVVRTSARELACRFDLGYWRQKDSHAEYHVERLWREVRLLRLAPVSQEMVLNYVSTSVLGLPKSY